MRSNVTKLLVAFFGLFVGVLMAQQSVSGVVTDQDGIPLPGVNITEKGTDNGTTTDLDGNYAIKADNGGILVFSFVGFDDVEKTVTGRTLNVQFSGGAILDEVVLNALGQERKKDDDLSSATIIKAKDIQSTGESGVLQSLAGKTSGVQITRNSGDPGAGAFIQIRGQNTILGDSNPLIVLDGVLISNSSIGGGTDGVSQQSRLNDINPDDIASFTVLKGASAAAMYGTGAANGVLVINTKRGKGAGNKDWKINVRTTNSWDYINVEHEKQSEYGQGYPTWWYGDPYQESGYWIPNVFASWGDKISERSGGEDIVSTTGGRFVSDSGNVYYPVDSKNSKETFNDVNRDQVFGLGTTWDKSVSLSYANDDSRYFISFSDWDQDGIMQGRSSYNRKTLRVNTEFDLSDRFTTKFNFNYTKIDAERIQQGSNLNGLYLGYLRTPADFNNTDYKGTYINSEGTEFANAHRGFRNHLGTSAPIYNNPGWTINEQGNPNAVNRFIFTPELTYKIKNNLVLTTRFGLDNYTDIRETFFPVNSAGDVAQGSFSRSEIKEKRQSWITYLTGDNEITDWLNLGWTTGLQLEDFQYHRLTGNSSNFTNPFVEDLRIFGNAEADNEAPTSYTENKRKIGGFYQLNFGLWNQLLIDVTGRLEKPSTLNEAVFYPSVAMGWQFSSLFEDSDFITFGKLRASYGEVGVEPSVYSDRDTFSPGGISSSWGDFLGAGVYGNPFSRSATQGNPNLKEERVKEYEFGADLRFFKDRVKLQATYYDRVTEDALIQVEVPPTTGYGSILSNAAEITNKGIEVDLSADIVRNDNFNWNLGVNFSQNKNLVTDLAGVESVFLAGFTGTSSRVVKGQPFGSLWGGRFLRDDSGNMVLDDNGFPQADPVEGVIGDPNPDWRGGLNTTLTYKGFSLKALFETSQGQEMWGGTSGVLKFFGVHPETANTSVSDVDLVNFYGEVIPAGTTFRGNIKDFGAGNVALDADWYTETGGGFGPVSEQFIEDASWTRLRELSLSYNFDKNFLSQFGMENMSISVSGRNLILWTDFEGVDPDLNLTGASKGRGLDYFTNPGTKSYFVTLSFGF